MMQSVIVTGATSMLGIATIKVCLSQGVRVVAISRRGSRRKNAVPQSHLLQYIECELKNIKTLQLPKVDYDVFYHFGWGYTDRSTRDNPYLQLENVQYTLDAVELAREYGCKTFIGAGSQAEYGFQKRLITEDTPEKPEVAYGIAKLAAGKLAKKLCEQKGMNCIWTRTFSVYGINDADNVMTSYTVNQFLKGEVAEFSKGLQPWNFLFEEDAGQYFYRIGERVNESAVINIASITTKTLREYVSDIAETYGNDFKYSFSTLEPEKYNGISPSVAKLISLTEYEPQVDFKEGMRRILESRKCIYEKN